MSYFIVDVESDGPILGKHSMVCFGALLMDADEKLDKTFYGVVKPISEQYEPETLAISGFSREEHLDFDNPYDVMINFKEWIEKNNRNGRPTLLSDNNGYDASWINYYFLRQLNENPFGWTSRRIGDMFAGFFNDPYYRWKKHRKTKHNHHPINDARANGEALIFLKKSGFNIKFK